MPFVIDNSVVCGWFIRQQASAYGDAIAERLQDDRAVAPAIWELELANVMRTACLEAARWPGDIRVAHRTGELVRVDELDRCAAILARAVDRFCA